MRVNHCAGRIYLGNTETIVLNDFRSIWEAFKKEEFLGRPPNIAFNVLINLEGELGNSIQGLSTRHLQGQY